jgi:hypothetical protein
MQDHQRHRTLIAKETLQDVQEPVPRELSVQGQFCADHVGYALLNSNLDIRSGSTQVTHLRAHYVAPTSSKASKTRSIPYRQQGRTEGPNK